MREGACILAMGILLAGTSLGLAATYPVNMTGAQESPPADPDGYATGTITLDPALNGGTISWSINYFNIDGTSLSGFHIHGPVVPPNPNAGVFVNLGVGSSMPPSGTLSGSVTGVATQINQILGTPNLGDVYYLNLHSLPDWPGGAVRGPLPEPATLGLLGLSAPLFVRRRRVA